uniref:Uncharacterized protein n=1 Tax=Aegilops tauschii subsp. strangulata TaxID=200361 RepID=A0A453CCZ0_AEGTS
MPIWNITRLITAGKGAASSAFRHGFLPKARNDCFVQTAEQFRSTNSRVAKLRLASIYIGVRSGRPQPTSTARSWPATGMAKPQRPRRLRRLGSAPQPRRRPH